MKRLRLVLLSILVLFILSLIGCDKSQKVSLRKADKELSYDTQKGEAILDSIQHAYSKMSTFERKYYQLLRLKADDKAYRPIVGQKAHIDSLVSYFQHSGDDDVLAEAYFYAGRVYYEIGDKPESLKFYQKANEKIGKSNYALQGDIYSQMANVYQYTDLYQDALKVLFLAYQADSLCGNKRNMLYDMRDIGDSYYGIKKYHLAESYFHKGLRLSEKEKDTHMQREFHHELAAIYEERKDWNKALYHVNQYFNHIEDFYDISGYTVTALEAFVHSGADSLTNKCIQLMLAKGNIFTKQNAVENLLVMQLKNKNDSSLMSRLKLYIQYTDSVIKENHAIDVKKVERSYNYNFKERENQYLRLQNNFKTIGLMMVIMIAILIFLYFYVKVKSMQQQKKSWS